MKQYKIISFLFLLLTSVVFGTVIADVASIPIIAGVGALLLPAFIVQEQSALFFGATLKSIKRPVTHSPGSGGGINNEVIAVLVSDIDLSQFPARGSDGVTITDNIIMKSGKYMRVLYSTPKKLKPIQNKVDTDDNPDILAFEVGIEYWYPGLSKAILEFQAQHGHSQMLLILRECATNTKYLLGEPCSALHMRESELQWEPTPSGGRGTQFGIKGEQGLPYAIYEGQLFLDPADSDESGSPSAT